jgi:translation initiation factor 1A
MPRNQGIGGNKRRKGKKNATYSINKNDLIKKDEDQMYARVIALLGNGRLNALCDDGETRMCKIRGKMMKKDFIKTDGIILVSRRDYQDNKADVIHKYNDEEVKVLSNEEDFKKEILLKEKREEFSNIKEEDPYAIEFADMDESNSGDDF